MKLSIKNYHKPTPKKVKRILNSIKRILAAVGLASFLTDHEVTLFVLYVIGIVVDEVSNFIGEEEKTV